jgi:predicted  nucleic acid-binding Zn-ribbon protein
MKLKNLRKKIRRLEKRLREGPKKLAKLREKLKGMEATKALKAKGESVAHARSARRSAKSSLLIEKTATKRPTVSGKVKRRPNISPERRAQLAAAMKARWAAKRAVLEATPEAALTDQPSTLERTPQVPESRRDGT